MSIIHGLLANTVMLFTLLAGLWGLLLYVRRRSVDGGYWGILVIGELLILAQGVLGIVLLVGGKQPGRGIHILYGAVAALTLPAAYGFTRARDDRRAALTYGLLCLFLTAIAWRSATTGG
ncbi:MAG: hypothetical protein MUO23_14005 [Anaerolineales bacterium]|nr:hypothetical protein [Anaerolineales bacterium]